jgi:hypothetical protein
MLCALNIAHLNCVLSLFLLFLSAPSFWVKGGQHVLALSARKRPFSVCTATHEVTNRTYANTKPPVVLTAFAAWALCN